MYEFWYRVIKANYGERAKLAYEDTDGFIFSLEILTSLIGELKSGTMAKFLDISNFPLPHPCYSETRKGQLGLLKSETGSTLIKEAIILKPKMYSLLLEDDKQVSRGKGIPSHHQKKMIHQEYREALNLLTILHVERWIAIISGM